MGLFVYEKIEYRRIVMNILLYLIVFIGAIIGGGTTLAMILMLFGTIAFKIYRKIRYGLSLYA